MPLYVYAKFSASPDVIEVMFVSEQLEEVNNLKKKTKNTKKMKMKMKCTSEVSSVIFLLL